MCIRQGIFPRELKLARVIPIYINLAASSQFLITDQYPFLTLSLRFLKKILYNHISMATGQNLT